MHHEKSRILAQLRALRDSRPGHFWATAGLAGASLFGMVAAFGTAAPGMPVQISQQTIVESLAVAPSLAEPEGPAVYVHEERIERGDSAAGLLGRLGIQDERAFRFLRDHPEAHALFRQLRPGRVVTARVGADGSLQELVFPVNGDKDRALFVERRGDDFAAAERDLQLETRTQMKSGEVSYSLFGATDAAGIPDGVAGQLADIFGGDIDFHRDLRKGDRFALSYEVYTSRGRAVRSGRILAAEFVNDGKTYRAVWYQGADGKGGYYTPDGKNLRKAFLRSPLEFSRVTSGFSLSRYHPLLHEWRAHKGIDYGAPIGTRVRATGDGVVEFVGTQRGYGRVIILRHQGKYETVYGHLSRYASGLRKGSHVAQGEVIGYVGMSGLATGPHLHYEFRVGNVQRNPLAIGLPEAPPLAAAELQRFGAAAEQQLSKLDLIRGNVVAFLD